MEEQRLAEEAKEKRVEHLQQVAAGRLGNMALARGWSAWHESWEIRVRQQRMLKSAGARLTRPKLAACVQHWRDDWEEAVRAAAAAVREAELAERRQKLEDELRQVRTEMAAAAAEGVDDRQDADILTISGTDHWRRAAVIRDGRFWLGLIWLTMVPGFTITGILFHQLYLAELAGVSMASWAAHYVIYAACAVIGTLVSGQLVDRFGGRQVAAHMMLPITLACAALWLIEGQAGVFLFFVFFGLAAGMPGTAVTAAMAELYGTRFLGEVKAIILPLGVFSSALSPMTMGLLIDLGYGMGVLMLLNIALALLAQVGGTVMMTRPARVIA